MKAGNNTYDNLLLVHPEDAHYKGEVAWSCPSNIALVKYWGKHGNQLPMNPSVSFTLNNAVSKTSVRYKTNDSGSLGLQFYFEGKEEKSFLPKLNTFLGKMELVFPFLKNLDLEINSSNTFPHSAGIASSASAMGALALCLCDIENQIFKTLNDSDAFFKKASFVARLGSGSAARSLYAGLVNWGETKSLIGSSDFFGTALPKVHPIFSTYEDSILILSSAQKKVSSTAGHGLMNNHPFAEKRFEQARKNHAELLRVIEQGDVDKFIAIVEEEALSLHAMMMTSNPGFILMEPGTIAGIEKIKEFRKSTGIKVCFTLDAGPNIHLLYPRENRQKVACFINDEFSELIEEKSVIIDRVGNGPQRLK